MNTSITSAQNSYIKELVQLRDKSRARKRSQNFLIEGFREISLALQGGYRLKQVLVDLSIIRVDEIDKLTGLSSFDFDVIEISNEVYHKLALRSTTEGILAVADCKDHSLDSIHFSSDNPLILVAEAPEKPGNIGALLRTADAAGIDAVFIANPKTDLYNPNIIRSSIGCIFTGQIITGTSSEIIAFFKTNEIAIFAAALSASVAYQKIDYTKSCAIVVGTEATGLSNEWLQNASENIIIPMQGTINSLNVSVSAAIVIFEAVRQREIH